ncbi:EpsG family protein [Vibrio vulnificus]|nr:EpsG family protein [Vibrio vulnificus]
MNVYVLIYFIFSSLLLDRRLNKTVPGIMYIGIWLIFLFMALRYGYGNDYFNYFNLHDYYHRYGIGQFDFEYLYKAINLISSDYQFVILSQSVIFLLAFFSLGKALKFTQCNLFVVALLFFLNPYLYLIHLSALRQSMAICSFVFFLSLYLMYRRYIFIFLMLAIPMLFHKASLVYLSIPFALIFANVFYPKKWYVKLLLLFSVLPLINLFLRDNLTGLLSKYNFYYEQLSEFSLSLTTLIYVLVIAFLIFTSKPKFELGHEEQSIYNIMHVMAFISLLFSFVALFFPMFSRVTLFFDFFLPFYFACSKFTVSRYCIYFFLILVYLIRNYSFLSAELWYNGFGSYGVFFL